MNRTIKYLSVLSGVVVVAEIFGKFFYFDSFKLFTFEIGYLSLIEAGLVFLFIYFFQAILNSFQDERNLQLNRVKTKSTILFLFLSFVAGVHLIGGEFQNFFILRKSFGAHMDMATFYDGIGHLFLFLPILVLIYWTVRAELYQKSTQLLSKVELAWVLFQSLVLSFGLALTVIKSAFILICLIPISALVLIFLPFTRKQKVSPFRLYPLYTFFYFFYLSFNFYACFAPCLVCFTSKL